MPVWRGYEGILIGSRGECKVSRGGWRQYAVGVVMLSSSVPEYGVLGRKSKSINPQLGKEKWKLLPSRVSSAIHFSSMYQTMSSI